MHKLNLTATGKTDQGLARSNNEDNYYVDVKSGLLIVADGMGGHAAGEIASNLAINVIRDYFQEENKFVRNNDQSYGPATNKLNSALCVANLAVFEAAQSSPQLKGMGTTIAAALMIGNKLSIAHIGDSRVYLVRSDNIELLTDDHSIVNEQVKRDIITKEEAAKSNIKNLLTKALGISPEVEADLNELTLFDGDILLLCSDGLNTMLTDESILKIISFAKRPSDACEFLINAANEKGGKDNITVIVGYIKKKNWYSAFNKFTESLWGNV
jgi:protein phosphatase